MNAPSVILQLILNLCTISIATCNKFFDRMTPFNGDKIRPRLTAKAGGQTFSWLFDTGASISCMGVIHYFAVDTSAECYQTKDQIYCKNIAKENQNTSKTNFDKNALPHLFNIDELDWYKYFAPLVKNPKLTPKWSGLTKITEINDTNASILLPNGKTKVLNVIRLKKMTNL